MSLHSNVEVVVLVVTAVVVAKIKIKVPLHLKSFMTFIDRILDIHYVNRNYFAIGLIVFVF